MTDIHLVPDEQIDQHVKTWDCLCGPFVDFQVEGSQRQVAWVIRHPRLRNVVESDAA